MRCEKCSRDKKSGSFYEFRYGTITSSMPMGPLSSGRYRGTSRVAGQNL